MPAENRGVAGHPSVVLLDDGELDRVRAILERLGADFALCRRVADPRDVTRPRDLLITTGRRAQALAEPAPAGEGDAEPIWLCVHGQDFAELRSRLRELGVHYLVNSAVDQESLRLLIEMLLHDRREQRVVARLPVGAEVTLRRGKQVEFANITQGSGAAWGTGVSFRVLEPLFLDVEAFGDVVPSGYHTEPTNGEAMGAASTLATIEGLAGARYQVTQQLSLGLAAGRGLTNSIGTPDLRGVFTAAYAPSAPALPPLHRPEPVVPVDPNKEDTDYDRFVDAKDKCPQQAEDRDGFEDADGCPDADNDKDGVLDEADRCPLAAEDKDGFEDDDHGREGVDLIHSPQDPQDTSSHRSLDDLTSHQRKRVLKVGHSPGRSENAHFASLPQSPCIRKFAQN